MKIIINTEKYDWNKNSISYEDIVKLTNKKTNILYTIAYFIKNGIYKRDGTLIPKQHIGLYEGEEFIFEIFYTGNA